MTTPTQTCLSCQRPQLPDNFYLNRRRKNGTRTRRAVCMDCYHEGQVPTARGLSESARQLSRQRTHSDYNHTIRNH